MKKQLLFCVAIIGTIHSFSQFQNKKAKAGIKAGATFSYIKGPSGEQVNRKRVISGFMGGVYFQVPLSNRLHLQPELLTISKGGRISAYNPQVRTRLVYEELSLNILYKCFPGKHSFSIGGGPAPALLIDAFTGSYQFKKFDLGINLMVRYEWEIGFNINLHYTHGLQNISDGPAMKNRVFGLSTGYTF